MNFLNEIYFFYKNIVIIMDFEGELFLYINIYINFYKNIVIFIRKYLKIINRWLFLLVILFFILNLK